MSIGISPSKRTLLTEVLVFLVQELTSPLYAILLLLCLDTGGRKDGNDWHCIMTFSMRSDRAFPNDYCTIIMLYNG